MLSGTRPGVQVSTSSQGEQGAEGHHEYFRKVEVTTSTQTQRATNPPGWLSARLGECQGDYYLLDASGTMSE
jgi:hypothetical protein